MRGNEIAFTEAGKGVPVVLLHGYPFDKSMWSGQIEALAAAGFRAIAPDLPGLGETKSSSEVATMDDMARDTAALLDHLGVEQAVICGLSMGVRCLRIRPTVSGASSWLSPRRNTCAGR